MFFNDLEKNEETDKEEILGDYSFPVIFGVEEGSFHDFCVGEVAVGELIN
jgi:hypothetical protein